MTFKFPRPREAARVSLRAPFTCTCGRDRLVLARYVQSDLPLDTPTRTAGPCQTCGRDATYRISSTPSAFYIHVEQEG